MKTLVVMVAGLGALSAPALAGDLQPGVRHAPQRVVMQCASDATTRAAFTREHGARPVFVTAREVEAARANGQSWNTPRCMTAREHSRLVQFLGDRAGGR